MIAAQLINALYSVVDRAYIGRIPGVGALALAGIGLTFPVILIVTAFTNLCGMGGGSLCSIARGEGRLDYAERIIGAAFAALLTLSVLLTLLCQIFKAQIMLLFGASGNTLGYACDYLGVYLFGTPFTMVALGMNPYINSQGFARTGMLTILIGAVANIILDPIFIFTLEMGVRGAALATVISQIMCAVWAVGFLRGDIPILRLRRSNIRLDPAILRRVFALGASNFTMAITTSAVQVAFNTTLRDFGGDMYIGAMTVISSLRELVTMALSGLSSGAQPVIGYNFGAGNVERVKKSIKFLVFVCMGYAFFCWATVQIFPEALIRIFNDDPQILVIGVPALRIYFCMFFLMSAQMSAQQSFVALGCAKQAMFFSMLRKVVIVAPVALLIPRVTNLGAMGVFWAEPISDVIGPIACCVTFYFTAWRRLDFLVAAKNKLISRG
jgi:putative MATE family efflux protein